MFPLQDPISMKQLRQYEMLREIGRGGMAIVHEAMHVELGRRVAIKTMLPEVARDERSVARFVQEAKAACIVRHPHVVEIFDFGTADGVPFLVMELLEGETMRTLFTREKPIGLEAAIALLLPVAAAVAHAHHLGIIHRDLKPANVFLTKGMGGRPWPKVLDFGISKRVDSGFHTSWREGITSAEAMVGTLAYMPPEQVRDASSVSAATDQYALGVILYEALTGRLPFFGPSPYQLMHNILHAPIVAPSALQASLTKELDAIVLRALDRDPAQRFPSVHAFASQLLGFASRDVCTIWKSVWAGAGANSDRTLDELAEADRNRAWTQSTSRRPEGRMLRLQGAALGAATLAVFIGLFSGGSRSLRSSSSSAAPRAAPAPVAIEPVHVPDVLIATDSTKDPTAMLDALLTPISVGTAPARAPARAGASSPGPVVPKTATIKETVRVIPAASARTNYNQTKPSNILAGTNDAPILE
jgi:serine/threonine-protein kinase